MVLAAVIRTFITEGIISEDKIEASLAATEQGALEGRTPEIPASNGLIDLLRRDLGLNTKNHPDAS